MIKQHKNVNKKVIKLTENDLHRIIKESTRKILNESCWYGDIKPFKSIYAAASKLRQEFEYANAEDYEPWDDCDGADLAPLIYRWAKKVEDEAYDWMNYNSSNT